MKLKEKVKLLLDNDVIREVQGTTFTVDGLSLEFIIHESRDAWRDGLCDISEKSTGLRLLNDKFKVTVQQANVKIATEEVNRYVREYTLQAIMNVINNTKKLNERI